MRKLKLNRETLRELDHHSIRSANGADTDLSACGGCPQSLFGCPTQSCASCNCTPNTGGTRSQGPFNCQDRTSSIDIPCTY